MVAYLPANLFFVKEKTWSKTDLDRCNKALTGRKIRGLRPDLNLGELGIWIAGSPFSSKEFLCHSAMRDEPS